MTHPPFLRGIDAQAIAAGAIERPKVLLPGGPVPITTAGTQLASLLAVRERVFCRGGAICRLSVGENGAPTLEPVTPASLASEFETVASLLRLKEAKAGPIHVPSVCNETTARLIAECAAFRGELPQLNVLAPCPVLVRGADGESHEVRGYDPVSGVFAAGPPAMLVPFNDAVELLKRVLQDFNFATPGDHARAVAALITPALVLGGLLGGRAPVDVGEADESQAGKGYRNKITASIYHTTVHPVTQRRGGVGSLEERFDAALIGGRQFISFDNMRGKVDEPSLEAFLTEDRYSARALRCAATINPASTVVFLTSNKAEMTKDLANRASCVRILKRPPGYVFTKYPEGDLLDHVRANQPRYLGAVFAIVGEWWRRGKPRTDESRHDFRQWAQQLDWICQNLLGTAPIMDGHEAAQARTSTPALNWLRDVALAVRNAGGLGRWYRTHDLIRLIEDIPDIELPGRGEGQSVDQEPVMKAVQQHVGRRMKQAFGETTVVEIDVIKIEKRTLPVTRPQGFGTYDAREYRFSMRDTAIPAKSALTPTDVTLTQTLIDPAHALMQLKRGL